MLTTLVRMLRITLSSCHHASRHPLAPSKTVTRLHMLMLLLNALTLIHTYTCTLATLSMLTFIVTPM